MILAAMDEAGYGPILGPLCVGMAAFRVDGAAGARAAEREVGRALHDGAHGLRFGDSKAVHRPGRPAALETPVLAFLAARDGAAPRDGAALLAALRVPPPPSDHPWYAGVAGRALPLAADPEAVAEGGGRLAEALRRGGVVPASLEVGVLPEGRYNEAVAREGSKAAALFLAAAALLERAAAAAGGAPLEVLCDRQGARARYAPLLQRRFPDRLVRVVREVPGASAYDLGAPGAAVRVRFEEKADARSAAVGLASMAAKYAREVLLESLNAWVLREAPGVRPTAGYWTDGLRFLRETAGARRRLGVDDGVFVRSR